MLVFQRAKMDSRLRGSDISESLVQLGGFFNKPLSVGYRIIDGGIEDKVRFPCFIGQVAKVGCL
jgi:hypothetical protein